MLSLLISALVPISLVLLLRYVNKRNEPPIFGIYTMPNKNYWFKFVFMYIVLKTRQLLTHIKRILDVEYGRSADGIAHVQKQDLALEQKYFLGDDPLAVDGVYFNGVSEDAAVIFNVARRQGFVCDALLMLKVNGEELLLHPNLPETRMKQEGVERLEYRAQGIEIHNFMPMRTWNVNYNGELKSRNDPNKKVNVKLALVWSAHFPPFNYDTQMSARAMASAMAREQWSRAYFKLLKKHHQTHYEQMGSIKGTVTLDDKEYTLNMPCVRDRSFGPFRDWRTFNRYVIHFLFLENGDCIAVGVVSQPSVFSHLTIGYVCLKSNNQKVFPVDSCDFQLYQHGENQIMPKDYAFSFEAGRQNYVVKVICRDEEPFVIGDGRVAKIYERWCAVEVNGVKGWACVECQYKNSLTIGYVCLKSNNQKVFPVDSCDFQLYQHGENQIMPKDYAFSFEAVLYILTIGYVCLKSNNQKVFPVDSCDFQLYQHGENQIMPKDYAFSFEAVLYMYIRLAARPRPIVAIRVAIIRLPGIRM